jgi:hypothetical protein
LRLFAGNGALCWFAALGSAKGIKNLINCRWSKGELSYNPVYRFPDLLDHSGWYAWGGRRSQWLTLPPTLRLPETTQSGVAAVNRLKIWYANFGDGDLVILLHGVLANSNYWGH